MDIELLKPEDYPKLIGLGGMTATTLPSPETSRILVARRPDGTIAAYWVAQAVVHIEPIWLEGVSGLGRGKVFMNMVPAMMGELAAIGDSTFFAFADNENMVQYALRLGMQPLPYVVFQGNLPTSEAREENQ